jgi:hypothetical protein
MLFTTRGTTDMPMKGVAFATPGVEHFLEGVMKTDTQDFLGKMEGFAVQGIQGKSIMHIILIHRRLTYMVKERPKITNSESHPCAQIYGILLLTTLVNQPRTS